MKAIMKNSEGIPRNKLVHTTKMELRIGREADRKKLFKAIKDEWLKVYSKYSIFQNSNNRAPEQWFRAIHEDVMNPEVEMNQDDYVSGDSSDYWFLYSISSFQLEIDFPFRENNPNDVAQALHGAIETYIDGRLVSSEEWEQANPNREERANPKYSQPRESDGNNKRSKAKARAKHKTRRIFLWNDRLFKEF